MYSISRLQKSLQRLGGTRRWGLLAAFQILILFILLITWPAAPPVSLTLVVPAAESTYWSALIDGFERQNPTIKIHRVEVENRQGDLTEKLKEFYTINFQTGIPYDLIYMDIIWVSEFADKGWLMNLSERISPQELTEFLESDVTAGRYNGKLYRIPYRSDIGLLTSCTSTYVLCDRHR